MSGIYLCNLYFFFIFLFFFVVISNLKFKHLLLPFNVLVLDAINHSSGRSLQTEVRLPTKVLTGQYKYGFDLQLMLKDVRQAKEFLKDQFEKEGKDQISKERESVHRVYGKASVVDISITPPSFKPVSFVFVTCLFLSKTPKQVIFNLIKFIYLNPFYPYFFFCYF